MHYFQTNQQEDTDAPASNTRKATKRYYTEGKSNSKKQKAMKSASGPPSITEDLRAKLRQVRKIIHFSHRVIGVIPGRFEGFGGEKYRKQHKNN